MINSLIIFGAKYLYLIVLAIAAIYFLKLPRSQQKNLAIFGLISLAVIFIVSRIAGYFYYDPRPFVAGHFNPMIAHTADNGFPSDHALLTSAVAAIIYFYNKKISIALFILSLLVGLSRVLTGIHHWIDILGAIFLSIICTSIIHFFFQRRG
ncbi:phosphatase PAP2 family protein [Patescibacteria group bacterium]|nr:phosphatase PAP2 family protein [Patescibacteria group bacterium]